MSDTPHGPAPRPARPGDGYLDPRPEMRVVLLDECLADAVRTPQDILELAAAIQVDMTDVRGGDLLTRLLTRARRADKIRALLKAAHDRYPDRDDIAWLHNSMYAPPPSPKPASGTPPPPRSAAPGRERSPSHGPGHGGSDDPGAGEPGGPGPGARPSPPSPPSADGGSSPPPGAGTATPPAPATEASHGAGTSIPHGAGTAAPPETGTSAGPRGGTAMLPGAGTPVPPGAATSTTLGGGTAGPHGAGMPARRWLPTTTVAVAILVAAVALVHRDAEPPPAVPSPSPNPSGQAGRSPESEETPGAGPGNSPLTPVPVDRSDGGAVRTSVEPTPGDAVRTAGTGRTGAPVPGGAEPGSATPVVRPPAGGEQVLETALPAGGLRLRVGGDGALTQLDDQGGADVQIARDEFAPLSGGVAPVPPGGRCADVATWQTTPVAMTPAADTTQGACVRNRDGDGVRLEFSFWFVDDNGSTRCRVTATAG